MTWRIAAIICGAVAATYERVRLARRLLRIGCSLGRTHELPPVHERILRRGDRPEAWQDVLARSACNRRRLAL